MKVLDLFSGIGMFSLGLERAGMETVAFCEYEDHAQKILKKHWKNIPIHKDVKKLDGTKYRGSVDVVCGGYPCQDLSTAGEQVGFEGERSSLYKHMLRIIGECMPRYAIFENVSGLLTGDSGRWFAKFLYDLAEVGYDAEWHCISAQSVGAEHERERVWVIAYSNEAQFKGRGLSERIFKEHANFGNSRWGKDKPGVVRTLNGGAYQMDRLARLGNSIVPQIPEIIGRAIMAHEQGQ